MSDKLVIRRDASFEKLLLDNIKTQLRYFYYLRISSDLF